MFYAKSLDNLNTTCENTIVTEIFNVKPNDSTMTEFLNVYNVKNLVKQKSFYKNPERPSCVDLILTNCQSSFQKTCLLETGLPDFHKMTISVMEQIRKSYVTENVRNL